MDDTQWLDEIFYRPESSDDIYIGKTKDGWVMALGGYKQAIKDHIKENYYTKEQILELIGDDEEVEAPGAERDWGYANGRNGLRAELRTKLEKL